MLSLQKWICKKELEKCFNRYKSNSLEMHSAEDQRVKEKKEEKEHGWIVVSPPNYAAHSIGLERKFPTPTLNFRVRKNLSFRIS